MSKPVKTFLLKLLALACLLVVVDFVAGSIFKVLFNKQRSGKYFTTTHALTDGREDVIIFGSSHAAQHFDAPLMAKQLNKTVFNFGNQGQNLFYVYPLVKTILATHKPQLVIINIDYNEFHYDAKDYERLSVYLPYYHYNAVVDSTIALINSNELLKARSALYRYNSTIGYILLNTYTHTYSKSMASLGFDPIPGTICTVTNQLNAENEKQVAEKVIFDTLKINRFINLVNYIKSKNVKLLVTTTPIYKYDHKYDAYKLQLQQLLARLNVNHLDDGNNPDFAGKCEYFHDDSHLNPVGAAKWTERCSNFIKPLF